MRLKRTLILAIIVAFSILLLGYCSSFLNGSRYDKFYPYDLTLDSPKICYVVGDQIKLIAKVASDDPATIRVYKDRTKSFSLNVRAAIGTQPDFSDSDFGLPMPKATAKDEIEVIEIGPWKPFQLELQGQVMQTKSKEILFDFREFGTFKKPGPGSFDVSGYWQPISPEYTIDSLEDSINSIILNVALSK